MAEKNIVVLGASVAGTGAAHYFLKHILPELKNVDAESKFHVYLVDQSSKFYWRVGAPRAVVTTPEPYFRSIANGFKQYDADDFTFLQGTATALDPSSRSVTVSLPQADPSGATTRTLPYYALVIATGTRTPTPLTSLQGDYVLTERALSDLSSRLNDGSVKTVAIAGGGPVGVEAAGEIAEHLNGPPGWFSPARPAEPKARITLYSGDTKLLPLLRPALALQAEKYLARLGVDVVHNVLVSGAEQQPDGSTTLKLADGSTHTYDVYLPAWGVAPNTEFLPAELKNGKGYVKTNERTLRVDDAGPRVYCVGDAGAYTIGGIMDLYDAVPIVMTNVKRDLMAVAAAGFGDKADAVVPDGRDRTYKPKPQETQLVPVGRGKGVGAVFGWKLPSFLVWMIKGRDYMTPRMKDMVDGDQWKKESKWTPKESKL